MSRVNQAIHKIEKDLARISGLDGIAADFMELKAAEIHTFVEYVLENHRNANIFDYFGKEEDEETVKGILICCDVGVLLTSDHEEFEFYSQAYDHQYGYYDENQIAYKEADKDKAIEHAKQYVANGVNMTYAIITNQGQCHYTEPFDDGNIEGFTYECVDVIYSVAKINGEIIEHFVRES